MTSEPSFRTRDYLFISSCLIVFPVMALTSEADYFFMFLLIFFLGWAFFIKNGIAVWQSFKDEARRSHNYRNIEYSVGMARMTTFFLISPLFTVTMCIYRWRLILSIFHH
jgi:hypothetical protein